MALSDFTSTKSNYPAQAYKESVIHQEGTMKDAFVYYGVTPEGHEVTAIRGCNVLDHKVAGNNPNDSYQPCPPDIRPVSQRMLRKWARETAWEMASEHGIPRSRVVEDEN
jgi:hypothetical protein